MPAAYHMTWEPPTRRWRKTHLGKTYLVSCRQLVKQGYLAPDAPQTKESSRVAANRWWEDRLKEGIGTRPRPSDQADAFESRLEARKRDWARRHDRPEPPADDLEPVREKIALLEAAGVVFPTGFADELAARIALGDDALWAERLFLREKPAPPGRTVGTWIDRFKDLHRKRHEAGELSPSEYQHAAKSLDEFRDWLGGSSDVAIIDADRWEAWYLHLLGTQVSVETKKKRLRYARNLVRYVAGKRLIPLPADVDARRYRFRGSIKAIPMPDEQGIKDLIDAASGQQRLHLLLMLNCGMYQVDVASLRHDEVDWDRGRIRRKRIKTKDQASVPVVDFPLWQATFDLLRQQRDRSTERVLSTSTGLSWVRDEIDDSGKRHKVDQISTHFGRLRAKLNARRKKENKSQVVIRPGDFRKAGATLLANHDEFHRFERHFLGHAPISVAERHYVSDRAGQDQFDRAVVWLGERFGF